MIGGIDELDILVVVGVGSIRVALYPGKALSSLIYASLTL